MAGGFLKGVLWGGVVSLGVAGTASVLSDKESGALTAAVAPDVTPQETGEVVAEPTPEAVPEIAPEPAPEAAPEIAEKEEADEPLETTAETAPEKAPVKVEAAAEPEVQSAPVVSSETITPSTPTIDESSAVDKVVSSMESGQTNTSQPTKPIDGAKDADVSADTNPAPVPQVGNGASDLDSPYVQVKQDRRDVQTDARLQYDRVSDTLEVPQDEAPINVATESAAPPPPEPAEVQIAAASLPQIEATPEPNEPEQNEAAPATQEPPSEPSTGGTDSAPAADTAPEPEAGQVGTLAPGVATNRLPTVQVTPTEPEVAEPEAGGEIEFDPGNEPIRRFAVPFENPEAKPLMAIVLMDDGTGLASGDAGATALGEFPYPITVAVDASLPDAAEKMRRYRADGFEVMAMIDLPEISSATDTEVSMGVALSTMPEAVAVLEGTVTGVQGNREMSDQITSILADTGHGLVTRPKGLNTAQKLATRNGVPAATLFRDFDEGGQKPDVIRRVLDQAVFRAGQDGGVIMVGRLRPDTISALLLWGLQDRAGRVALAPVSAVLTAQQGQ